MRHSRRFRLVPAAAHRRHGHMKHDEGVCVCGRHLGSPSEIRDMTQLHALMGRHPGEYVVLIR